MSDLPDRFTMRVDRGFMRALDEWRARQRPIPSRSEALRRLAIRAIRANNVHQDDGDGNGDSAIDSGAAA